MNSLSGLPESQSKQRGVACFDTFHDAFREFLHQVMINKENNNQQISEKMNFSVCKFMVLANLAFRCESFSTNFVSILFWPQKTSISAQA